MIEKSFSTLLCVCVNFNHRLIDITHCSAECSQRISALRLKFSNIIFDVIPSSHLNSDPFLE